MAFYPEGIQSSYRLQTAEFKNKLDLKITKQDKTYTYVNDQFYSSVFSLRLPKKKRSLRLPIKRSLMEKLFASFCH